MGNQNVSRAYMADCKPLLAKFLLIAMAHAAHDKDDPPRYFGGQDWLAFVSGSDVRYVRRLMRGMEKDGWIAPDGYVDGRRAWVLRLPLSNRG